MSSSSWWLHIFKPPGSVHLCCLFLDLALAPPLKYVGCASCFSLDMYGVADPFLHFRFKTLFAECLLCANQWQIRHDPYHLELNSR